MSIAAVLVIAIVVHFALVNVWDSYRSKWTRFKFFVEAAVQYVCAERFDSREAAVEVAAGQMKEPYTVIEDGAYAVLFDEGISACRIVLPCGKETWKILEMKHFWCLMKEEAYVRTSETVLYGYRHKEHILLFCSSYDLDEFHALCGRYRNAFEFHIRQFQLMEGTVQKYMTFFLVDADSWEQPEDSFVSMD